MTPATLAHEVMEDRNTQMNNPVPQTGLPQPGFGAGVSPLALWALAQQQLSNTAQGKVGKKSSGGGSGGSGGRRRGGGGGGGGRGGGSSSAAQAQKDLEAFLVQMKAMQDLYNNQVGSTNQFADAARARAGVENAGLVKAVNQENANDRNSLAQRTAALQQIYANQKSQLGGFQNAALNDLRAQGIGTGANNSNWQLQQNALAQQSNAQRLYGNDMNTLANQAMQDRLNYAAQSQRDVLGNIGAQQQSMLNQLAQQRQTQDAQARIAAIQKGVKGVK